MREESLPVGDKIVPITYYDWRLLLVLNDLSWYDAVEYCRGLGGYLAEVEAIEILQAITSVMAQQISGR